MSNHLSYLDIPVLGSLIRSSFVAKSEVEAWPLFGFLSKLQQTEFIQRKRSQARNQKSVLQSRIESGESLIVFPEGTSTDGQTVLPFKSSLFSLAFPEDKSDIYVQPITIKIKSINGKPVQNQETRDLYAWHIDMDASLASHLWGFAKTKGVFLSIEFHPVLQAIKYGDRKTLAKLCHENVCKGLDISANAA